MLDARIAELGAAVAGGPADATARYPAAPLRPAQPAPPTRRPPSICPSRPRSSRACTATRRCSFSRANPGGRGPPLAAKRLTSAALGTQMHLSAADSMVPGRALADGQHVSITARVSFSGQPTPATGDLYGELTYEVGHDGVRDLVIDKIAE